MTTTLLSVSTTGNRYPFSQRPNIVPTNWWHGPTTTTFSRPPPSKFISLCSPSSTSTVEQSPPPPPPPPDVEFPIQPESLITDSSNLSLRGCKACGREEIEKGCNGKGRIQGGIATVPGFGWWPIKAYRPCPGFVASGGRYRRQGQTMDEVAFGRVEREASIDPDNEAQSSKKRQSPRKRGS